MDYCKYHPLKPATFICEQCRIHTCDRCNEDHPYEDPRCLLCEAPLGSLGAVNYATPFWRRLEESFRYPLITHARAVIIAVAILTPLVSYLPFGLLWSLLITGAFMKYCFVCLEDTSQGRMEPPDITSAYGEGLKLIGQLLVIFIGIGVVVYGAYRSFGPGTAGFVATLSVLALPAILILFGLTDHLLSALNPLKIISLISAIGLPYALLLAFILIMMASVGILSEVVGRMPMLANVLESMVSSYYTIVIFHIMGYMIFQYQGKLGYTAREQMEGGNKVRPEREQTAINIDVNLKEGNYEVVLKLLNQAVKQFPGDDHFRKQRMEFLLATENVEGLDRYGAHYLEYLADSNQEYELRNVYKRITRLKQDFIPESPRTRHRLAQACLDHGDFRSAIKLIKGLHKKYPDYADLSQAFRVMLEALEQLPNTEVQAEQCRALIRRLEQLSAQNRKSKPARNEKATFEARETRSQTEIDAAEHNYTVDQEEQSRDLPPIEYKL